MLFVLIVYAVAIDLLGVDCLCEVLFGLGLVMLVL